MMSRSSEKAISPPGRMSTASRPRSGPGGFAPTEEYNWSLRLTTRPEVEIRSPPRTMFEAACPDVAVKKLAVENQISRTGAAARRSVNDREGEGFVWQRRMYLLAHGS